MPDPMDAGDPPPADDASAPTPIDAEIEPDVEDARPPDDAATTPPESACAEAWVTGSCVDRQVHAINADEFVISPTEVSIARTSVGRVGLTYNYRETPDQGSLAIIVFDEDAPSEALVDERLEYTGLGHVIGIANAIAAGPTATLHLAYWNADDFGANAVEYRTVNADNTVSSAESIATDLGAQGTLAIAVGRDGTPAVAIQDASTGSFWFSERDLALDRWKPLTRIATEPFPELPGRGAVSMVRSEAGNYHVGMQYGVTLVNSQPRHYSIIDGIASSARTLDNNFVERLSGVAVQMLLHADRKIAMYFDWVDGAGEIRAATFRGSSDEIEVEEVLPGIPLPDQPVGYPLAADIDAEGDIHFVVALPDGDSSVLRYYRQDASTPANEWIVDTIATDLSPIDEGILVDFDLDEERRPHIVYFDAATAHVHYASIVSSAL